MILELRNFIKDHYKHFGTYQLEFEYEDKVYNAKELWHLYEKHNLWIEG